VKRREEGLAQGAGRDAAGPGRALPSSERTSAPIGDRSAIAPPRERSWPDTRLVRECLRGSEEAWAALLDKYKNLIFSIPIKQGIPRDDAADVFQRVCLLLLAELPHLREAKALPMWLIRVTSRECLRWRRQEHPYAARETTEARAALLRDEQPLAEQVLAQVKEEQILRDAMRALSPRCRQLIEMLFFEAPARPYQEIARALGLAAGSIGFIRGRCLTRLRRELEKMGFR
jgi:RNA polymerase sigma factor (sigma-70 family)